MARTVKKLTQVVPALAKKVNNMSAIIGAGADMPVPDAALAEEKIISGNPKIAEAHTAFKHFQRVEGYVPGNEIEIELDKIDENPENTRIFYLEDRVDQIKKSLVEVGQLDAVTLTLNLNDPARFYCIVGHTRVKSARSLGWKTIRARIIDGMTDFEMFLISHESNDKRESELPLEHAISYERQISQNRVKSANELAAKISKSKSYIYRVLRYHALPQQLKSLLWANPEKVSDHLIDTYASAVDSGIKEDKLVEIATAVFEKGLSVQTAKDLLKRAENNEEINAENIEKVAVIHKHDLEVNGSLIGNARYFSDGRSRITAKLSEDCHEVAVKFVNLLPQLSASQHHELLTYLAKLQDAN